MAAKTRAHFPLKPECASKTEPTIESCLRRRRKPGAKCALGGRAHDHRGRPCPHRGREWSAWLERACPYCLSTASPRPQTPGRRRSRGSLSDAQVEILPHVRPKKKTRSVKIQTRLRKQRPAWPIADFRNKRYFFEVRGLPPTMSLSGGSPLDASRFLHRNDEP